MDKAFKVGYAAVVGRPNVGKSTLINHLIGQKLNITSRKPQTTRHAIFGIHTDAEKQIVFVDTPGIHENQPRAINRYMNRVARAAMQGVDLVVFVVERFKWTSEDEAVALRLKEIDCPLVVAINKIDQIERREDLLAHLTFLADKLPRAELVPVSALKGSNLELLEQVIADLLPAGEPVFDADQITDRSVRFIVSEIIREKILRQLGAEVPYAATVEIEAFETRPSSTLIHALIHVEREGQKRILIGENGEKLRSIGTEARKEIEKLLERKVMLHLWVRIKKNWSDDERALQSLGYRDGD